MKALYHTEQRTLEWRDESIRPLDEDEVRIKTIACAISIGAELPTYQGSDVTDVSPRYPRKVGYESYGEVTAIGRAVTGIAVEDRVLAFYGQRTEAIVKASHVYKVPKQMGSKQALLAILSCDAAKGVRKLGVTPSSRVLVTGLGTIGLLTIDYLTRHFGVTAIDGIDPDSTRAAQAIRLGAASVTTAATDRTYAFGIECSARNEAFQTLQRALEPGGKIVILSDGNREPFELDPSFYEKELTLVASSDGWDYRRHFDWYFTQADAGERLEPIFDYTITYEDVIETFAKLDEGGIRPLKVLVRYEKIENGAGDEHVDLSN